MKLCILPLSLVQVCVTPSVRQSPVLKCPNYAISSSISLVCSQQWYDFPSCTHIPCNFYPMSVMPEKHISALLNFVIFLPLSNQHEPYSTRNRVCLNDSSILYFNNHDKFITFILSLPWSQVLQCCYNNEINDAMTGWSLVQDKRRRHTQNFCWETSWEMISWNT